MTIMVQSSSLESKPIQDQSTSRSLRPRHTNKPSPSRQQPSRSAKTIASAAVIAAIHGTTPPKKEEKNGLNDTDQKPSITRKRRATSSPSFPSNGLSSSQRKKRNNNTIIHSSSSTSTASPSTYHTSHQHVATTLTKTKAKHATNITQPKPYRAGDQVEALKWVNDDTREWYCARIVTNANERKLNHTKQNDGSNLQKKENAAQEQQEKKEEVKNEEEDDNESLFYVHYEGWTPDHADWVGVSSIRHILKHEDEDEDEELSGNENKSLRYGPLGKESETSWADYRTFYYSQEASSLVKHHTGLVQDQRMLWHDCPCHSQEHIHPERPDRINAILKALHNDRLLRYFGRIRSREATVKELLQVHGLLHVGSYCPMDTVENVADNLMTESNPRTTNVLSIRELLNQPPSTTPSPTSSPPPTTITLPTTTAEKNGSTTIIGRAQGMEGGKVVKADKNQIRKQRRRFSSAAASQAALNGTATLVNPPQLVYEMVCGELAIEVDTPFHPLYTSLSARIAAGSLMELADQVVEGSLHNGFALIRPPGHHAEQDRAMGFCFFNNVAVAVASTLEKYADTIKKVLIIDWDIHHGNGTEKIFYKNPNVLYISLHRWEYGHFYPRSGAPDQCGEDTGEGYNVNIAFNTSKEKPRPMGDTEFLAAFYHIVLPIARQFAPDMIFVSAGFDAAEGHPDNIGGYQVTPRGFALLTKLVKDLAEEMCHGRLVLSLEGGYELEPLANSAAACVAQLLPAELVPDAQLKYEGCLRSIKPNLGAIQSLQTVAEIQHKFWHLSDELMDPNFRFLLPQEWRAKDSISIRPKRTVKPIKMTAVQGY